MRRYWASGQIALRQFTVSQLLCSTWVPSEIFSIIFPMACNYLRALFCALVEKCFWNAENVWKHFIEGQLCFLSHRTSLMIYWWTIHIGNPLSLIQCIVYTKDFRNFVHFYIFDQPHVTFMILFMIRFIVSPVVNCAAAIANLSSTCKYFRFFILFVQHLLLDKVLREQRCQKTVSCILGRWLFHIF